MTTLNRLMLVAMAVVLLAGTVAAQAPASLNGSYAFTLTSPDNSVVKMGVINFKPDGTLTVTDLDFPAAGPRPGFYSMSDASMLLRLTAGPNSGPWFTFVASDGGNKLAIKTIDSPVSLRGVAEKQ